jgi:hypothetical protein
VRLISQNHAGGAIPTCVSTPGRVIEGVALGLGELFSTCSEQLLIDDLSLSSTLF